MTLLLFGLASHLEFAASYRLWVLFSLLCFAVALFLLLRAYPHSATPMRLVWLAALPGFWETLRLGQIYAPLILCSVAAWLLLERGKTVRAGILIGIVIAIKPNFAIWPLLLLIARSAAPAAYAAVAVAALIGCVPLLWYGPSIYVQWLQVAAGQGSPLSPISGFLIGLASRFGYRDLGLFVAVVLLLALAVAVWKMRASSTATTALALGGGILASPISWSAYFLVLLPLFFSPRRWSAPLGVAAALLVVPTWLILAWAKGGPSSMALSGLVYPAAAASILLASLPAIRARAAAQLATTLD